MLFLEHREILALKGPVPEEEYEIEFGHAAVVREGRDATVVALALMVHKTLQACEQLATACDNLKGMRGVQEALVQVKAYEDEGDRVLRDALAALFRDEGIDPLIVIRWKDIYEALEDALDACEKTANVLGNIVVKNQ